MEGVFTFEIFEIIPEILIQLNLRYILLRSFHPLCLLFGREDQNFSRPFVSDFM